MHSHDYTTSSSSSRDGCRGWAAETYVLDGIVLQKLFSEHVNHFADEIDYMRQIHRPNHRSVVHSSRPWKLVDRKQRAVPQQIQVHLFGHFNRISVHHSSVLYCYAQIDFTLHYICTSYPISVWTINPLCWRAIHGKLSIHHHHQSLKFTCASHCRSFVPEGRMRTEKLLVVAEQTHKTSRQKLSWERSSSSHRV